MTRQIEKVSVDAPPPKTRKHQGWYVTEAGGAYTKLCRIDAGYPAAEAALTALLASRRQMPATPPPAISPPITSARDPP